MGLRQIFNVRDYGATGNGSTDDTAACQAAIDACPTGGGEVLFPRGTYRISSSLRVIADVANGNKWGMTLRGEDGGASGASNLTVIEWNGSATDQPMIKLWSRDNIISNLFFRVAAGKTVTCAVDIDQDSGGTNACTNNRLEDVRITKGSGTMTDGVVIGLTAVANAEYMRFVRCYISNVSNACVNIPSTTGQAKSLRFHECTFSDSPYGIYHVKGSFTTYGCAFGALTTAAIRLGSIVDYIAINETDCESCVRFLVVSGGSNASWAIKINGGRMALELLHADGRWIDNTDGGPLVIENCLFGGGTYNANFKIRSHSAEPGSKLVSIGNAYPNDAPFEITGSTRNHIVSLGDRGLDSGSTPVNLDDRIVNGSDVTAQTELGTLKSLTFGGNNGDAEGWTRLTELVSVGSGLTTKATSIQIPADAIVYAAAVRVTAKPGGTSTMTVSATTSTTEFQKGASISTNAGTTDPGTKNTPANYNGVAAQTITFTFNTATTDAAGRIRVDLLYFTSTPPTS